MPDRGYSGDPCGETDGDVDGEVVMAHVVLDPRALRPGRQAAREDAMR
jgi:hypothetical protein